MGILQRIERKLEGAVDDGFARVFGGKVAPQEVENALQREAEDSVEDLGDGGALAPNSYTVVVSPTDHAELSSEYELNRKTFSRHLEHFIRDNGWQTYGDVVVEFDQSTSLHTGQFRARGRVDPDAAPRPVPGSTDRPAGPSPAPVPPVNPHAQPRPGVFPMTQNPGHDSRRGYDDREYDRGSYEQGEPSGHDQPAWDQAGQSAGYGAYGQGSYGTGGYDQRGYDQPQGDAGHAYGAEAHDPRGYDQPQGDGGYGQGYADRGYRDSGYQQGGWDQRGGHEQGTYGQSGGYQQGGYGQAGGYDQQGYDQGGAGYEGDRGYQQGDAGYYSDADYRDAGYQQGGYDQGGYAPRSGGAYQGGYDRGAYDQGAYQPAGYEQGYGQATAAPTYAPTGVTLVLEDGSNRTFSLRDGSNVIGRGQDAQFRLPDTGVSRRHVEIRWDGRTALLHDLNSTNGTTVNDVAVSSWELADGDRIRLGHSDITVRFQ
ncbi:FhaA domain-containing protein [uncultured Williamsia sp.]|uniref:FhaA domain-containing protein n=1 Tax=uncultured Williamsia sp. TaxID=259311 RepID=UPI0026307382|nr:FhaA domain-containing protein [uncultured Williamsia sp.]